MDKTKQIFYSLAVFSTEAIQGLVSKSLINDTMVNHPTPLKFSLTKY